jgi:phage terminase large subunit-like protein
LTISTAGVTSTQNHCYQQQQDAQKVLEGIFENERLFGIVYTIDERVEWTSRDAVIMANPNLGVSNDAEAVFDDREQAIRNAAKQNGFRSMHLNEWTGASSAWMRLDRWAKCSDPGLTEDSLKGLRCWIGADLASRIDLAATVRLFRKDVDGQPDKPHYYALTRAYLPEEQVNDPASPHYKTWAIQGVLTATSDSRSCFCPSNFPLRFVEIIRQTTRSNIQKDSQYEFQEEKFHLVSRMPHPCHARFPRGLQGVRTT